MAAGYWLAMRAASVVPVPFGQSAVLLLTAVIVVPGSTFGSTESSTKAIAAMAVATTGSMTTIGKQLISTVTAFAVSVVPFGIVKLPLVANTRVEPAKVFA